MLGHIRIFFSHTRLNPWCRYTTTLHASVLRASILHVSVCHADHVARWARAAHLASQWDPPILTVLAQKQHTIWMVFAPTCEPRWLTAHGLEYLCSAHLRGEQPNFETSAIIPYSAYVQVRVKGGQSKRAFAAWLAYNHPHT